MERKGRRRITQDHGNLLPKLPLHLGASTQVAVSTCCGLSVVTASQPVTSPNFLKLLMRVVKPVPTGHP